MMAQNLTGVYAGMLRVVVICRIHVTYMKLLRPRGEIHHVKEGTCNEL